MRSGKFRRARRRAVTPSIVQRPRTVREWEDLLDWRENHRRAPLGTKGLVLTACALLFGWALRRSLRDRGWRRDRGRRVPTVAGAPPGQLDAAREMAETAPPGQPQPPAPAPAGESTATPAAHPPGRRSVLVVDDDKTARKTIKTILARASFDVSEAGTVAEALRRLDEHPDWVLLDLMLPDGSGCGVLREVSGQASPSRVCVISGAGPALLGEARSLGARHVLSKPVDVPRLLSILVT
jgi:CheY-like chemotaxis protein